MPNLEKNKAIALFSYLSVEEEQHGEARAQYGTRLIKTLAEQLMPKYGNTFSKRNLDYFRQFYLCFNDLEIVNTRVHNQLVGKEQIETFSHDIHDK